MPSPLIQVPQFPNVPFLPGVPQLARPAAAVAALVPAIIQKLIAPAMPAVLWHATQAAPIWGVFKSDGSTQAISPDSIMDFGYRSEFNISSFPVQAGQFANYNKVLVPYETTVRMVKGSTRAAADNASQGSSLAARRQFELDCETVAASLDLYTIITPEKSYVGVNAMRLEISRRETAGSFYIEAEMFFKQIQEVVPQYSSTLTAAANTANAQNPAAVPVQGFGLVQPQPVPSAVTTILTDLANGGPHFQSTYFPNPLGGN